MRTRSAAFFLSLSSCKTKNETENEISFYSFKQATPNAPFPFFSFLFVTKKKVCKTIKRKHIGDVSSIPLPFGADCAKITRSREFYNEAKIVSRQGGTNQKFAAWPLGFAGDVEGDDNDDDSHPHIPLLLRFCFSPLTGISSPSFPPLLFRLSTAALVSNLAASNGSRWSETFLHIKKTPKSRFRQSLLYVYT